MIQSDRVIMIITSGVVCTDAKHVCPNDVVPSVAGLHPRNGGGNPEGGRNIPSGVCGENFENLKGCVRLDVEPAALSSACITFYAPIVFIRFNFFFFQIVLLNFLT